MINRQVVLESRPRGVPVVEDFGMAEGEVPTPGPGEFVVRNLYLSLEAEIRGWLDGEDGDGGPVPLGGVVRGPSVGRVLESRHPHYATGDVVFGLTHWEEFSLVDDETHRLKKLEVREGVPLSYYLGALGVTGQTAWIGLNEVGRLNAGETVVVSAAAGATGSVAGQVARLRGCKVIGIVGSPAKVEVVTEQLGFDHAIDYRALPDLAEAVGALCPEGVDLYFDNVGGATLDAMLLAMKDFGRIVCCGTIGDANQRHDPTPVYHLSQAVARQLRIQGFLHKDHGSAVARAMEDLHHWIETGELRVLENVTEGIERTGEAYARMMSGETIGKNLIALEGQGISE